MVKAAFFSDVHGNLPALVSMFADLRQRGVNQFYGAGDYVGFGPLPAETLKMIRESGTHAVQGNCDARVAAWTAARVGEGGGLVDRILQDAAWTAARVGEGGRRWLGSLPARMSFSIGETKVVVVHGSVVSNTEGIHASITSGQLEKALGPENADLLVCGHTHLPFVRTLAGVTVVNCGSAGRPTDGDPRGSYALVEFDPHGGVEAQIVRFEYPVEELAREINELRPPGISVAGYRSGRSG